MSVLTINSASSAKEALQAIGPDDVFERSTQVMLGLAGYSTNLDDAKARGLELSSVESLAEVSNLGLSDAEVTAQLVAVGVADVVFPALGILFGPDYAAETLFNEAMIKAITEVGEERGFLVNALDEDGNKIN